jgi:mRNA interferase RelE/StbE
MAGNCTLTFARSARKELEKIPVSAAERIRVRVTALQQNPRPPGAIKLQGESRLWRLRIGEYQVIYTIDDTARMIDVSVIRHRRDVYRDL